MLGDEVGFTKGDVVGPTDGEFVGFMVGEEVGIVGELVLGISQTRTGEVKVQATLYIFPFDADIVTQSLASAVDDAGSSVPQYV